MTRNYVVHQPNPESEGLKLGLTFLLINVLADLVLVVGVMKMGISFYSYAGVWLAYALLIVVPRVTSRAQAHQVVSSHG
jgi:hypothetical protein